MSRLDSEKCRLCSKLAISEACQRYGSEGTGCWKKADAQATIIIAYGQFTPEGIKYHSPTVVFVY